MTPLTARILEQKHQRRKTLAALPFPEKVRIVETLRDVSLRIAAVAEHQALRKPAAGTAATALLEKAP